MEKVQTTDKPLFDNLRKLINLIDSFRDVGLHQHIELPRIAVLGTQSSGKSSLLENIVGLDFLPRGSGVVTRMPLQLRMIHVNNPTAKPYGIFESVDREKKIYNFDEIRTTIQRQTDRIAGSDKRIVDHPIKLTIYSYECPDLTLIDLPGITKISVGNQDQDVERVTIQMAKRYCIEQRTIILCVIPANADLATSQGLHLAKQWDPQGVRTLGVITKIDIMDRGTDASKMILNQQIQLKLGYVGIKNRSQQDINNKVKVSVALNKQQQYFKNHPVYRNIHSKYLGTRSLTKKLTQVLEKNINTHLKTILNQINLKVKQCEAVINSLGQPLPKDGKEKIYLIWNLLSKFTANYIAQIKGNSRGSEQFPSQHVLSLGSKIKAMFEELYYQQSKPQYQVTIDLKDSDIEAAIKNHQGDSIPGFPSIHAFLYLLSPKLQKLKQPALELLSNIYGQIRRVSADLIYQTTKSTLSITDQLIDLTDKFLQNLKNKTQQLILDNIDCQIGYIFTNDAHYLEHRTQLIPSTQNNSLKIKNQQTKKQITIKKDNEKVGKQNQFNNQNIQSLQVVNKNIIIQTKQSRQRLKKEAQKMFIKQLRLRTQQYFKIVIKTLREIVPKNIGHFLVRKSQQQMQHSIYNQLLKNDQMIDGLCQSPQITQQRETALKTLQVLSKAKRIIKREVSAQEQNHSKQAINNHKILQ